MLQMIFGFIIIGLQICTCVNKEYLVNDVLDVVRFTKGEEIVFVKASKVAYFKFGKDAFNDNGFVNVNNESYDVSLSFISDDNNNNTKALFKVNDNEYEIDNKSLKIDLQSKTNFTIRVSPLNTPTAYELVYLSNFSYMFNSDNDNDKNVITLFSNSTNFTYKDGQNYIIQSFLFTYSSIFPILLILMGITLTFSGAIYKQISLCLICICSIASLIDEMILNNIGFLTYLIGGFLILFSIIFGICISIYIIYCNEHIALGILLSSFLICLSKITMPLIVHTQIEDSFYVYNVVYFLSIVIGVAFCLCKGKNVQRTINRVDNGYPNEIVALYVCPKIKYAKMLILFYMLPYSLIGAFMITSGINYMIGGNYYWKLYKCEGLMLDKGNEMLFMKMNVCLFIIGVVFQFISFCFVMESKEIEYDVDVDIAESLLIQNDNSSRGVKDLMLNGEGGVKGGEEKYYQIADFGNDDDDNDESEIKDSYPIPDDDEE